MSFKLFDRRLILVSGKGGVGKTSVAAALALLAARQGLKTLLCELDPEGGLARLFKVAGASGGEPQPLKTDNLHFLFVDVEAALEEYLSIYMRFKAFYRPIVKSPAMRYFLRAAPGFKELLTIGKIWWEEQLVEGRPKRHRWDTIIVDAPATGHGISFMGVSHATVGMVRLGPIKSQAQRMVDALQDPGRTSLVIVTIPEEMPVNETIELANRSYKELGIHLGPIIINLMPCEVFGEKELNAYHELHHRADNAKNSSPALRSIFKLSDIGIKRRELALSYVKKLRETLPDPPFIEIPQIPDWNWDRETIDKMADCLMKGLDSD